MKLLHAIVFLTVFSVINPVQGALRDESPPPGLDDTAKAEWWIGAVSVMTERCGHMSMVRDLRLIAKSSEYATDGHMHWLSILSPQACSDVARVGAFILSREDEIRQDIEVLNDCSNATCVRRADAETNLVALPALLAMIENDVSRWFGYDRCSDECL